MRESKKRSVIKGVSYRLMATGATMSVTYLFTSSLESSLKIGLADFLVKLSLYFINERIWSSVIWGYKAKQKETDYSQL